MVPTAILATSALILVSSPLCPSFTAIFAHALRLDPPRVARGTPRKISRGDVSASSFSSSITRMPPSLPNANTIDHGRRDILLRLMTFSSGVATSGSIIGAPSAASAKDELFKPNPLTNPVCQTMIRV